MNAVRILPLLLISLSAVGQTSAPSIENNSAVVTRATLSNGLRVVLVRNSLAPVVTSQVNVLAGGSQDPAQYSGLAHALEHMAFRGCEDMTADQTSAIYAQLGDENNAETQQDITQFYVTVPAADLDVALEAQAKCLRRIDNSEEEWTEERRSLGAEVDTNLSDPEYELFRRMNLKMFAGTPYAMDALGTRASLERITGATLKGFYRQWYTPSNEILVIVGDIEPAKVLKTVERLFGDLRDRPVPQQPEISLRPFVPESFTLFSDTPHPVGYVGYRLPGTDSPDYAATMVLADVLQGAGSKLDAMVSAGLAVNVEFEIEEKYRKASLGLMTVEVSRGQSLLPAMQRLHRILHDYATYGVPEVLVRAARNKRLTEELFESNSISGLADAWSNAVAAEGRLSPREDFDAIQKVTVADVNRVARRYLLNVPTINATMKPVLSGGTKSSSRNFRNPEKVVLSPVAPIRLPSWAAGKLATLKAPQMHVEPVDMTLANGIRLLVRTDRTTHTVTLAGSVRHNAELQALPGKEGVTDILDLLYGYGTEKMGRLAFEKALDDISAEEKAGYRFSLRVPAEKFSRGLQLLAQNELSPALTPGVFLEAQKEAVQQVTAEMDSSDFQLARALDEAMVPAGDPTLRRATPRTVSRITLDDVRRHHSATIRPDLTTIVVVGDVTPEVARTEVERWFGEWKANGPAPQTTLPPVPSNKAAIVSLRDFSSTEDSVVLAQQLQLDRFSPEYYPLQLGTQVLDGGFYASRLYRDLRRRTGYVYSVDATLSASATRAMYSVAYDCDPKNIFKVRAIIEQDLEQMRKEKVSNEELHQAKSILLRQMILREASQTEVAAILLERSEAGLSLDEPVKEAKRYMELDAETVRKAFAKSIIPGNFVQIVLGSLPKAGTVSARGRRASVGVRRFEKAR